MASKGQKFSKYSEDIKKLVLANINNGVSTLIISQKYNIPRGTILTWSHKYHRPDLYPNQGQKEV